MIKGTLHKAKLKKEEFPETIRGNTVGIIQYKGERSKKNKKKLCF